MDPTNVPFADCRSSTHHRWPSVVSCACRRDTPVSALQSISGVTRVVASDGRGPAGSYEVESVRGTDVRREIARTIVTRGWGLLELRPMRMSLEEIFLQVTTDEKPEEAVSEQRA